MTRQRILTLAGWGLIWAMTALVIMAMGRGGLDKFSDTSGWARAFVHWGYPLWFRMLIGVLEVSAALLLLWPRTAPIGAIIVIVVMLGGVATHWIHHDSTRGQSEAGLLVFSTIVLIARRKQLSTLLRRA